MHSENKISLNGSWIFDYLSNETYISEVCPELPSSGDNKASVISVTVPGYWEDMTDEFRKTALHTKLSWNPMYTLQRYPQSGYCPDMALPNPVGCFLYKKKITLSEILACDTELYVGGAQNTVSAWINGVYLGRHEGYSAAFFFTVPSGTLSVGENEITLTVSNNRLAGYMGRPVSGLTSRAANECTGGIWGDVELRFYPDGLRDVWVSTAKDISSFTVKTVGAEDVPKTVRIYDGRSELYALEIQRGKSEISIPTDGYELWSPSSPRLYAVIVETENQRIERRFGIRRFTSEGMRLFLNGKPYFFRGTCEHCYQPVTVHPTREKNYYRRVLRTLKELGFNSIRFHTWVPMPEYMEAADELGILIEVETPNNTTYAEWQDIVKSCRHYASVCAYSSGNEMVIDEDYIAHLRACADLVHTESDSLFSPMSAMRGIEYHSFGDCKVETPFPHNPKRLAVLDGFCDLYNSYSLGLTSYTSESGKQSILDERNSIYKKPLLSHEICIHGTYIDLSLKDRYRGTRIGDTEFMSSVETHLADKGLLDRANLYYRNSAAWQRILRKHCFETVRRSETFAGYDFLGDIDTHWHTFGYCVGMMNEFYELKPGETVENVLRYNGDTVLLADLPSCLNLESGSRIKIPVLVSNYGEALDRATLTLRVKAGDKVILRREIRTGAIPAGEVNSLYELEFSMPRCDNPMQLKLIATLSGGNTDCDNEWDMYLFPKSGTALPAQRTLRASNLTVASDIDIDTLIEKLSASEKVLLFGTGPFTAVSTSFQLSVAGRTSGHLATVIDDHPLMRDFPHVGYCSWQFRNMINGARAAVLDITRLPHSPIIDIASTYKNAYREAMLFEYRVGRGKLLVCTLNLSEDDPGARWLREHIVAYAMSEDFLPKDALTLSELRGICGISHMNDGVNDNEAQNKNDITMTL